MRPLPFIVALLVGCDGSGSVLDQLDGAPLPDAAAVADRDLPELPDAAPADASIPLQPIELPAASGLIRTLWADNEAVYWGTDDTITRSRLEDDLRLDLATGEANPLSLHGDPTVPQTWLFWSAGGTNPGIRRSADSTPGALEFVPAFPTPYHLALDDANLFWTDYAGAVYVTSQTNGGTFDTLAITSPATGIALTHDWVYFEELSPKSVQRVGKTPGSPTVIVQPSATLNGVIASNDIDTVYWADDHTLVRFAEDEGGFAQDIVTEISWIRAVTVYGGQVYWIVGGSGNARLKRMPITSTNAADAETIADHFSVTSYTEIRVGGTWVFWFSGTHVYKAPL